MVWSILSFCGAVPGIDRFGNDLLSWLWPLVDVRVPDPFAVFGAMGWAER